MAQAPSHVRSLYNGPCGDKFSFGACGCRGKRLLGRVLPAGSAATCDGRCVMAGVGIGVAVGNESDDSGVLGLMGYMEEAGLDSSQRAVPSHRWICGWFCWCQRSLLWHCALCDCGNFGSSAGGMVLDVIFENLTYSCVGQLLGLTLGM